MKGLATQKTADAIAEFVRAHRDGGPQRAVFCTYDFDPVRFEAVILPVLGSRGRWRRTLVLADGAAVQKDGVLARRASDASYELAPVRLRGPGVFHPKLCVVQAGANFLVGVGSGNLTPGGLGGNLELMLFASSDTSDGRLLAASALQFLDELRRSSALVVPRPALRLLERIVLGAPRRADGPVLHSLHEPLLDQIGARRPGAVKRVAVLSPWHSSSASAEGIEPSVLRSLTKAFGVTPVVHTEGEPSASGKGIAGPALGKDVTVRVLKPPRPELEDVGGEDDSAIGPRRPARLHAKAYVAAGKTKATMWFGSANCTEPALLRSAHDRGNVELLVEVALERQAVGAIEADLDAMFELKCGDLRRTPDNRMTAPRGRVLAGYVSTWEPGGRLSLEVMPRPHRETISIAAAERPTAIVKVDVPASATSVDVDETQTRKLLEAARGSTLWEHSGTRALAFPLSVPSVPDDTDAEASLDDLLRDLAGRVPAVHEAARRRRRSDDAEGEDAGDVDDDRDRELALLTKSAHEGRLDRIAVRVEMLRRRLSGGKPMAAEARTYYSQLIGSLDLDSRLRDILTGHLAVPLRSP